MATTTTAAHQIRIPQAVAPELDNSGTSSPSKTEVDATIDAENTQGFIGHEAEVGS